MIYDECSEFLDDGHIFISELSLIIITHLITSVIPSLVLLIYHLKLFGVLRDNIKKCLRLSLSRTNAKEIIDKTGIVQTRPEITYQKYQSMTRSKTLLENAQIIKRRLGSIKILNNPNRVFSNRDRQITRFNYALFAITSIFFIARLPGLLICPIIVLFFIGNTFNIDNYYKLELNDLIDINHRLRDWETLNIMICSSLNFFVLYYMDSELRHKTIFLLVPNFLKAKDSKREKRIGPHETSRRHLMTGEQTVIVAIRKTDTATSWPIPPS